MTAFNAKWKYEKLAVRLIVRVRGHFALLFCRARLWIVQRFSKHACTAFVLLIKPFVWWCSLTSWFAPDSVHMYTTPKEFKNRHRALFLRLGLRSDTKTELFVNTLQIGGICKTPPLWVFVQTENILKRTFLNTIGSANHVISLAEISSNKNIKRPVIVAFLISPGVRSVDDRAEAF